MSYSLTRFAIYETVRDMMGSTNQGPMPFYQKVLLGAFGGWNEHTHTHTNILLLFFSITRAFTNTHSNKVSLPTGFTGGFVGTPADMVNVR